VYLDEPFTATPYYDFYDSFLQGLKLSTWYESSNECTSALVYFFDDCIYLKNNNTLKVNWEDPLLNFTKMLGGNFSVSVKACYNFGYSFYTVTYKDYSAFGTIGNYFMAFLFN